MSAYPTLRTIHLLAGALSVPMLLMYGVSAVQMAHNSWFTMRPNVVEATFRLDGDYTDGRQLARDVMTSRGIHGEITSVQPTADGYNVRITSPGTVHAIRYQRTGHSVNLRTSTAGFIGMMNRLHHAAGFAHEYVPLRLWGLLVFIVSCTTLILGATGIWMWWLRKQERTWGVILIAANLAFGITVLALMRAQGP